MSFEANKTFDEINSEIELNVYGKSKFAFLEIGKATVRGVESSLSGVGAMVEWIGDSVQQGKTLETLIGANPSTVGMKPLIKFTDKRSAAFQKEVGRGITEWGDTAVKFWQKLGVKRIILSRELSLKEVQEIRDQCPEMELECFVHGSLCMA